MEASLPESPTGPISILMGDAKDPAGFALLQDADGYAGQWP